MRRRFTRIVLGYFVIKLWPGLTRERGNVMKIFYSKKFWMAVIGVVVVAAADYGLELDAEQIYAIAGLFGSYVVGQGLADFGKEAK